MLDGLSLDCCLVSVTFRILGWLILQSCGAPGHLDQLASREEAKIRGLASRGSEVAAVTAAMHGL